MELIHYYKRKKINFRLLNSFLNEITTFTNSSFKGSGSFEMRYTNETIRVNSLDELYKEWDEKKKETPEFFNFHIDFYKKRTGREFFKIYMFGSPSLVGFSVNGLPKQDAITLQKKFQNIFNVELEQNIIKSGTLSVAEIALI